MKKTMFVLAVACVLVAAVPAFAAHVADVRNVRWGMSHAEVVKAEPNRFKNDKANVLKTEMTDSGLQYALAYFFEKDKLDAASYTYLGQMTQREFYSKHFKTMVEMFSKIYGQPKEYSYPSEDILLQQDAAPEATVTWDTERTFVVMQLAYSDMDKSIFRIVFRDTTFQEKSRGIRPMPKDK